ncbi:GL12076 [Drosophila persimilis]|uniref:GL12076 n=1 Tax=Drosophila persimilis TaxID=7234 RepID=B4GLA4_DROPE|nr:GL12076 [Drosophila persimilis]
MGLLSSTVYEQLMSCPERFVVPNVFDACKEALFKHASNLHDANEKAFKTLAAKNYLYGNVLEKITKFNIEAGSDTSGKGHFLAKITIFSAFEEGIKMRTVVKHFGDRFMNLLEGGIYSSPSYVRELKINEYSRILSYLFELNVHDDDFLRNRIVKCITKTVGLAKERVQLHVDLVEYLPELINFAQTANAGRKKDIVRLYFLFATELSVNYRHQLCLHMQDILPKLCEYHNEDVFRDDTRKIFFQCVINSLHSLYPKLSVCDFNTFGVPLNEKWPQTMLRLKTIVDMEIRKNSLVRYKTAKLSNDKFCESFIKMSALVMYIVLWDLELRKNDSNGDGDAPKKLPRPSDKMEVLFGLIDKKETTFDDVWFAIYAEVLQLSIVVLNVANYQQALSTVLGILQMYGNVRNLTNVRICVRCLLAKERELLQSQSIQENYLADLWSQMGNHLISVTTTISEEIKEKQLMLQMLIKHDKLNQKMASSLLHNFISNEMLKRNECIATIREIYIRAGQCGQDKASATLEPIISWAYGSSGRCSVTQVIHNIASIDANLLADTFSISIINFLDEQQLQQLCNSPDPGTVPADQNLLAYRHNKQLLCLDKECLAPVNSLLKIALKKSYTSRLTAKIVRCVGSIALRCPDIYLMENFLVLCKSTAKFITMPTLDVRFATISTLGIVLNTNCVASDPISHSLQHSEFCRELYESIEFKKLAFNDEDDTRNSNSMMVQMLLAIFSLSSFHQEIALKELLYHCARRRLGEAEFVALQNQVPGVDQTMRDRIRPYADILLHKWSSQRWPILKRPCP